MRNVVELDFLSIFNMTMFVSFVVLVTLGGLRMSYRFMRFFSVGYPVPTLLKRDVLLFIALGTFFGTALIATLLGIQGLGKEPLWVVPRSLFVIISMAYWVWIEYHLEDVTD